MTNAHVEKLSPELLLAVARLLDTDALLALEQTSHGLQLLLRDVAERRCQRECLGRFLQATIATQRMLAPVPPVRLSGWLAGCLSHRALQLPV